MGKTYTSKPRDRTRVLTFTLDDRVFEFRPPKDSSLVLALLSGNDAAPVQATFNWLSGGLSEEDNDFIIERLANEDDDLDFDTLGEIVQDLMEEASGRPTKQRRGFSSPRR